jgi:hypothetical protein
MKKHPSQHMNLSQEPTHEPTHEPTYLSFSSGKGNEEDDDDGKPYLKGPYIDTRFEGIGSTFQITVLNEASIPSDPSGAAGPSSVITVVNVSIEARKKDGSPLWTTTLVDFFSRRSQGSIPSKDCL